MNRIREIRVERGLRQIDLAERAGIKRASLSRMERPDASPRIPFLRLIATALNVPVDALIGERVA